MIRAQYAFLIFLLGACAAGPADYLLRPTEPVGWPAKEPRVELRFAYEGSRSTRRHLGFWSSFANLFTGGQDERLIAPNGMAMTEDGVLIIADPGQRAVHRITMASGDHQVMRGTDDCPLITPVGVAVLPDGRAFVSDSSLGHIVEFSAAGTLTRAIGNPETLGRPTGICFDRRRRRLLVVDTIGARIIALSPSGKILQTSGKRGTKAGEFNYPTNVAVARDGSVLVVDTLNFRVVTLDSELRPLRSFGLAGRGPGTFASPKGVATDSEGNVYVVDAMFDNVQVFDSEGQLLLVFSARGTALGALYLPSGITIDSKDRVIVADSGNARIQVFQFHARDQ
jgi:DNA-binding beta-propeller fold protein YncE